MAKNIGGREIMDNRSSSLITRAIRHKQEEDKAKGIFNEEPLELQIRLNTRANFDESNPQLFVT